jgi:hypothetical protein
MGQSEIYGLKATPIQLHNVWSGAVYVDNRLCNSCPFRGISMTTVKRHKDMFSKVGGIE